MKNNLFGLDIGTTKIKAVWFDNEGKQMLLNSASSVITPSPGLQSESPFDHQELAQVINKLVNDAKITTPNVAIALPENHIFTKVIDMPVLSDKELSTAIYWEAEEHIPLALDTMTLDWTILKRPKEIKTDQKMQVLLVAAPNLLVKRYQEVLQLAGLNVMAIETETLSVIRAVLGDPISPTSIILNIGSLSTSLSIVQKGIIVFNYSIPLGGIALSRAIVSDFGLNNTQAEEYKKIYGLSSDNLDGKVAKAIEPIFGSILIEIKKAIEFYNERYKNESPISQIILCGASANLPDICLYFVKNIGIETVLANPWKKLNVQGVPPQLEMFGPEYTVACGLAIKEYE